LAIRILDHFKFVFNNIGLDHLINNEININTFKRFFGSFVREREFDCVNKKCSLEFFKNVCIFQGKQPYLSNVRAVTTIEANEAVASSDFQGKKEGKERKKNTERDRRGRDRRTESELQLVLIISLSLVT